jgi:hypothetical protein
MSLEVFGEYHLFRIYIEPVAANGSVVMKVKLGLTCKESFEPHHLLEATGKAIETLDTGTRMMRLGPVFGLCNPEHSQ